MRDGNFVVEFLIWHALMLTHLFQFAEDLIINNMPKCVDMDCAYSAGTGGLLMPQKKNSDALEVLRRKAGVALGRSVEFVVILKGLPWVYNKNL